MGAEEDRLSKVIIGAAIEVHRQLGPGLLESTYERCLAHELSVVGLDYARQVALPVVYKGLQLECGYRLDLVVEGRVILELKTVSCFEAIHEAQILTYLKLSDLKLGLLFNFNVPVMRKGIKRVVNNL
ncbi:MAG: GxxExxY protein [Thermodesulfobacteriota bacterium]